MNRSFFADRRNRLALGLVAVLLLGLAYLQWHRARQQAATAQYSVLDAKVVWTNEVFRIANTDSQTWLNCQFVLNRSDADHTPGYIFFRDRVQPREVLQIAHSLFTDPSGKAYSYSQDPPTSFYIRCEDVNDKVGVFSGHYAR